MEDISISCELKGRSPENTIISLLNGQDISYEKFDDNYYVLIKRKQIHPVLISYNTSVANETMFVIDTSYSFTKPILLTRTNAFYPPEAIIKKLEGKVTVRLLINKKGRVNISLIDKSSGSEILDSAAVNYARTLKFFPALANDEPVKVWLSMVFEYKINI